MPRQIRNPSRLPQIALRRYETLANKKQKQNKKTKQKTNKQNSARKLGQNGIQSDTKVADKIGKSQCKTKWRSQGLSGWARAKMRKKIVKFEEE